ncbi:MAG TPA: amidohydrolase family protein [Bacteriovoracaceae bacterium]|nr:amidohydrolase family protein [Bacteriovoracaceae bacterium]
MAARNLSFYIAAILNPQNDKKCDFYPQGLLVVERKGKKTRIRDLLDLKVGQKKYKENMNKGNTVDLKSSVIMPGFFDMHFHWVQDDVRQMPKDSLLGWLEKYTFPSEMKFAEKKYSEKKARSFFKKLTMTGTFGGACYSSVHEYALKAAMKEAIGDFVIGNVLMNMNSPAELTQKEDESLSLTKKFIRKYGTRHCFTPRFAITTSPRVMKKGSAMADEAKCFKQTHLAETPEEIAFVLSIYRKLPGFEKVKSYTEIYEKTGMLGKRSLMGHGIHLSPAELKILSKTMTTVIHCPTSNAPLKEQGLGSGLFDFRKTEKACVRWALGSDIGGGPHLSMFDVMRSFVVQNARMGVKEATYIKALYRSTLAGAEIMGLADRTGNLAPGKEANFIVVEMKGKVSGPEQLLKKLITPHHKKREGFENLVKSVYLQGQLLGAKL